jgi:serine/threonine-protein kinase
LPPEPALQDLLSRIGKALEGRYTIERELGRGGMGIVYLANDLTLKRKVAIKVLRPELTEAVGHDRFLREIRIEASLDHPNIVALFDSGEIDGLSYYVMPHVKGESLRERILREERLSLDEVLNVTRQISDALAYAHEQGVVHRDIKPENILISDDRALVADFGVAKATEQAGAETLSTYGIVLGTPEYMSPEQVVGERSVDARADVWALGCVVFEMLAGDPPFSGRTRSAIVARVLQERVPSLDVVRPGVPVGVIDVVQKALSKVPADRHKSAAEFSAELERVDLTKTSRRGLRPIHLTAMVVTGALAVLAVVVLGRIGESVAAHDARDVAVLYFQDASEGAGLQHVATGVTEDLIDELTSVASLGVISAAGVRPFRSSNVTLDSIVSALEVGTVVDGSVDSSDGRLVVNVRIVDGSTGEQRLGREFEEAWAGHHRVGRSIAEAISLFLRRELGEEIRLRQRASRAQTAEAWDLVRRAEELTRDGEALDQAGDPTAALRTLLTADSVLTLAEESSSEWIEPLVLRGWLKAKLSAAWRWMMYQDSGGAASIDVSKLPTSTVDWLNAGVAHADRALEIAPGDPEALELRGALLHLASLETHAEEAAEFAARSEIDLRSAVAGDPSRARAWHYLSFLLHSRGEFAEAALAAEKALEADEYLTEAGEVLQNLMITSLERARFSDATHWCDEGNRRFPVDYRFTPCRLTILGWSGSDVGDVSTSWRLLSEVEAADTAGVLHTTRHFRLAMIAAILARAGLSDSALVVLAQARGAAAEIPGSLDMEYYAAYVRMLLGEQETALRLLRSYLNDNPWMTDYVSRNLWFEPLRDYPEFSDLIAERSR